MRRPPASRATLGRPGEPAGGEPTEPRPRLTDDEVRAAAELLKALADPTRLHILDVLSQRHGDVCVCDLEGVVGLPDPHSGQRPRQSTISHHLRVLRDAGLVGYEKRGQWAYYYVEQNRLALARNLLHGLRPRES